MSFSSEASRDRGPSDVVGHIIELTCPHCAKVFRGNSSTSGVRSNYRRHLLVHTGERPFKCAHCGQSFTTNPNMRRHTRHVHPGLASPSVQVQHLSATDSSTATQLVPAMHLPPTAASSRANDDLQPPSLSSSPSTSAAGSAKPAVYTCEDCEMELANKISLRRHRRYNCPFRENNWPDPVQDALGQYRAYQTSQAELWGQGNKERHKRSRSCNSRRSGSGSSACSSEGSRVREDDGKMRAEDASHINEAPRQASCGRRLGRNSGMTFALTEAEKSYLYQVAQQSGLKFVEDAYASDSTDSKDPHCDDRTPSSSSSASSSSGSASPYRSGKATPAPQGVRTPSPAILGVHKSPKCAALHGPSPYLSLSPGMEPRQSRSVRGGTEPDSPGAVTSPLSPSACARGVTGIRGEREDAGDGIYNSLHGIRTSENLLFVCHHRRRSGNRRERRILAKRLRAQEGALMSLASGSSADAPQQLRRERHNTTATPAIMSDGLSSGPMSSAYGCAGGSRSVRRPSASSNQRLGDAEGRALLTPQLLAQADGLLALRCHRPCKLKMGVSTPFVCPYCEDFTSFGTRRLLRAHQRRKHPKRVAEAHGLATITQARPAETPDKDSSESK